MKALTFKNRKTGKLKTIRINAEISNITAAHQVRDTYGKDWGLVEGKQPYEKK